MSVVAVNEQSIPWFGLNGRFVANRWRLSMLMGILALFAWDAEMREIVMGALSEAYFQVTVFVAVTLAMVFWFEKIFAFDLGQLMKNNVRWQPVIASALGVLPGCGGARMLRRLSATGRSLTDHQCRADRRSLRHCQWWHFACRVPSSTKWVARRRRVLRRR